MGISNSKPKLKTAIAIVVDNKQEEAENGGEKVSTKKNIRFSDSHVALLGLMMPVYYMKEDLTRDDVDVARVSWQLVLGDPIDGEVNPYFLERKAEIGYPSTVSWFFDTFYKRFFDIHPTAKPLFSNGIKTQGRFMVKMITLLLSNLDDKQRFSDALVKLAQVHNRRGIKAIEYGVVGEILFYTLRTVTGPAYDAPTHRAWVLVFSSMLRTLIPIAVQYELSTDSKFQGNRDNSSGYADNSVSMGLSSVHSRDEMSVNDTMSAGNHNTANGAECPFK